MNVYVLREDEQDSQRPVKVYSSVEAAKEANPGEWTQWGGWYLTKEIPRGNPVWYHTVEHYTLEEFEVE